jgi:hypothetical protein
VSAFLRLPGDYRALCLRITYAWQLPNKRRLSVQNRRVRFAADMILASEKKFPNRITRQQRRAGSR